MQTGIAVRLKEFQEWRRERDLILTYPFYQQHTEGSEVEFYPKQEIQIVENDET